MKSIQDKFDVTAYVNKAGEFSIQPRASVYVSDKTETSMTWKVSSLSYPARDYDDFEIEVSGGGSTKYKSWTSSNSSYNTQVTVTGLKPNTRYKGTISAKYNGKWFDVGSDYDYTDEPSLPPPTLNRISISNITPTSFDYRIYHTWGDSFRVEVWERSTNSSWGAFNTSSTYGTISGLKPNTEYKIQISVYNDKGSDYDWTFVTTDSYPKLSPPSVTYSPSVNSVSMTWSSPPAGAYRLRYTLIDTSTNTSIPGNFPASARSGTVPNLFHLLE